MSQSNEKTKISRRKFLKGSVATGAGVAVAAAMPSVAGATVVEGEPEQSKDDRYRLTQHIVDYYKSAAS